LLQLDDLLGKRFEKEGKGPETFNCWSLCREVYKRIGLKLPPRDYIYDVAARTEAIERGKADFIELEKAEPFCGVTLKLAGRFHMGVVLADGRRFIHCSRKYGVIIEPLKKYKRTIDGYFRYGKDKPDKG